ncbi:MAG TPA: peptidoglycan-binding domain-containing protein [Methylocella sp.]|nr:peptidoglycan-binding domain-containing protein [Methylocella sp.]
MKRNTLLAAFASCGLLLAGPAFAKQMYSEGIHVNSKTLVQIQKKLNEEGFNAGPANGKWGPKTREALMDFQKKNKLEATGKLDRQTMADLGISWVNSGRSVSKQGTSKNNVQSPSSNQSTNQQNNPAGSHY